MPDMRFAPPNPLRIADRASGLNSLSVRSHNERLVLSLLLQNEATTRLEIGEKSGLSAQTISVIVRSLEREGLVVRGESQKGRVGPPTTTLMLHSEGAYSVGVCIGYHKTDIVLIDFTGSQQHHRVLMHQLAGQMEPAAVLAAAIQQAISALSSCQQERIAGIGLVLPATGTAAEHEIQALHEHLEAALALPVFVQNDITAAAAGESLFGAARQVHDYLYFYLGAALHGRLVLNHKIYNGTSPLSFDVGVRALKRALPRLPSTMNSLQNQCIVPENASALATWQRDCAATLSELTRSTRQFIELTTVVVSSYLPESICAALCAQINGEIPGLDARVGRSWAAPKAVGAASLPFSSRFMVSGQI